METDGDTATTARWAGGSSTCREINSFNLQITLRPQRLLFSHRPRFISGRPARRSGLQLQSSRPASVNLTTSPPGLKAEQHAPLYSNNVELILNYLLSCITNTPWQDAFGPYTNFFCYITEKAVSIFETFHPVLSIFKTYFYVRVVLVYTMKWCGGVEVWPHSFLTLGFDEDECSALITAVTLLEKELPILTDQEPGWTSDLLSMFCLVNTDVTLCNVEPGTRNFEGTKIIILADFFHSTKIYGCI